MTANSTNIVYPGLSYKIMGAIFEVHKKLGPGFPESVSEKALVGERLSEGLKVETQKTIDLTYKDKKIGAHRLDLVVEQKVVVELKTVERFSVHHKAQLLSYLKTSGDKLGTLANFSRSKVEYQRVLIR